MSDSNRPLFADLQDQFTRLRGDLTEIVSLRAKLAWMEIQDDLISARSLAIGVAIALVMGLAALPVLLVALANSLDGWLTLESTSWMIVIGLTLVSGGALTAWFSWHRFRRRLVALQETMEELREDVVWLKEWAGRDQGANEEQAD